jgi:hypothetical protein
MEGEARCGRNPVSLLASGKEKVGEEQEGVEGYPFGGFLWVGDGWVGAQWRPSNDGELSSGDGCE